MSNGKKFLAPSSVGYVQRESFIHGRWKLLPNGNWIPTTANPIILASNKSPVIKSDRKSPTSYTRMISKCISEGDVDHQNNMYHSQWDQSIIGLSVYPNGCSIPERVVAVPNWMVDKVVRDAKLEFNQVEANILEDLGQLRGTGIMIAEIVMAIFEMYKACRSGNFAAVRRRLRRLGSNVPRSIANGWLMYFYGIKPLVSTIDALAAKEEPIDRSYRVRRRCETAVPPLRYIAGSSGLQSSGKGLMQAQCELRADIRVDGVTRKWAQLGLTSSSFTDAVVTAWALLPYSFVLDWFVPVEGWLRSLHWSPFLKYQGGYTGKRHYVNARILDPSVNSTGGPYQGRHPRSRLQVLFYKRETYPFSLPPSYLSVRLSLTSTQIISASALIIARG